MTPRAGAGDGVETATVKDGPNTNFEKRVRTVFLFLRVAEKVIPL